MLISLTSLETFLIEKHIAYSLILEICCYSTDSKLKHFSAALKRKEDKILVLENLRFRVTRENVLVSYSFASSSGFVI